MFCSMNVRSTNDTAHILLLLRPYDEYIHSIRYVVVAIVELAYTFFQRRFVDG